MLSTFTQPVKVRRLYESLQILYKTGIGDKFSSKRILELKKYYTIALSFDDTVLYLKNGFNTKQKQREIRINGDRKELKGIPVD